MFVHAPRYSYYREIELLQFHMFSFDTKICQKKPILLNIKDNLLFFFHNNLLIIIMNSINYAYLAPPSKARRLKYPKSYVYEHINGQHVRRLFAKPPYEQEELDQLAKIKDYLNKKSPFMNYSQQLLLRLCYSGHFLISEINEKVKAYDEWHENQLITKLQKPAREILQHGHIYSYGRDNEYSPNIYVRAAKINLERYTPEDYYSATANLLQPLEEHMLVGGVIQKWNLIVDFEHRKVPVPHGQLLNSCLAKIAAAYPYRLKRLVIVNTTTKQDDIKNKLIAFLEMIESEAKLFIVGEWYELDKWIREDQREKKYGGSLTDLCQFWPIHTTNKYEETESVLESEDDYKSVLNDETFFHNGKQPGCHCGQNCQIY